MSHSRNIAVVCKVTKLRLTTLPLEIELSPLQRGVLWSLHPFLEASFCFDPQMHLPNNLTALHDWQFLTLRAFTEIGGVAIEGVNLAEWEKFITTGGLTKLRNIHSALLRTSTLEFPRYKIDSSTTSEQLHGFTATLVEKIEAHRLAVIRRTPEANEVRLYRATMKAQSDRINIRATDFKFSLANAKQALALVHKLSSRDEIYTFWLKILCTSQETYYSRATTIRPVDISELVEEFESVTINHDLKLYVLGHLRALFVLAETVWGRYASENTVTKLTEVEVEEQNELDAKEKVRKLLAPLRDTIGNLSERNIGNELEHQNERDRDRDDSENAPIKERRILTLSNGKVIYFPHRGDFATTADYFIAMSAYRLAAKNEKLRETELRARNVELMRVIKSRAQSTKYANVNPDDVL